MSSTDRLSFSQIRAILLVLIGTFLEYFDLVLYVHLAIVLNPLFFPASDPWVVSLLSAFTFSASYILRPLGAFVFGYLGDQRGRKSAIVWTSTLMGFATLLIACLPSYAYLGFTASCLFIAARVLQGFSSVGEIVAAQVFVAEITEKSRCYNFLSVTPSVAIVLSSLTALIIGKLSLSLDPVDGWRWPFVFGSCVALIGAWIRLRVIESPIFLEAKKKKVVPTSQDAKQLFKAFALWKRNYWLYFGIESLTPLTFYFALRVCSDFLKKMGLSATEIMVHNFFSLLLYLPFLIGIGLLALRYDPLVLLRRRLLIGFFCVPFLFGVLSIPHWGSVFFVQVMLFCFCLSTDPAKFQIIRSFPVIGRCTNFGSAYAISHAAMYVVTSMILVSVDQIWGLWGVGALFMTTTLVAFLCARIFKASEDPVVGDEDERAQETLKPLYGNL